jgi:eukaryotic-like serine/threonine-protein kinase
VKSPDERRPAEPSAVRATSASGIGGHLLGAVVADRYRMVAVLGRGGHGEVYEAEDLQGGPRVAIKTLLPSVRQVPEAVRRFEREARAGELTTHPNIVDVIAVGALDDGSLYLVMELIRGANIATLLEGGPLHPRRALVITRQALTGLAHAHARGLVHRDLKPENLMITRAGRPGAEYDLVKILDFGLVKLIGPAGLGDRITEMGAVFGSALYMSPEQALGKPTDARTDLYAIGVLLVEMLTGTAPFAGANASATLRKHVAMPAPTLASLAPAAAWCTAELELVVASALAKRVDERFATAADMIAAADAAAMSVQHVP